jgi:DNA gyrase/topoisomerase IV subunit A
MDKNLPILYRDYGKYSNWRNMPSAIDGLKPVERRVLLSAFKIAKNKFAKSRQIDTYTCGHYHPHGECYGTIVQLVKQGFLTGQGNFGTNVGLEPVGAAAPRYTECKIGQNTIDLAFKMVNYVPWVQTELDDKEPFYLPIMFPACLLGNDYTQGIGFGYKTFIPCYDIKDLYQRLLWLLGVRKRKPIIAPLTDCIINSKPEVLDELLTTGKAKLEVEGVIDVNPIKNTVTLRSWPPGKRFESFLNKFSKELNEGLIGFTDLSVTKTNIVFQVLRERNRDKIFKEFVSKIQKSIAGFISFETILTDTNQKVILKSIDDMLLDTYKMFCATNEKMLKDEIKNIENIIAEYNALEIIRPTLANCLKSGFDIENTLEEIEKATLVSAKVARTLFSKYKISKLLTLDTDTGTLENGKKELEDKLQNLEPFVLEQYNGFT